MPDLAFAEAENLIALAKVVNVDLALSPRKNHAGYLIASARVEDEFGATIPGMTVEIEAKAPLLIDACRNTVSLFVLRRAVKWRVHQIEIQPSGKRSHNELGKTIYGPHEHRGDKAQPLHDTNVSCDTSLGDLFALLCLRSNISFNGRVILP